MKTKLGVLQYTIALAKRLEEFGIKNVKVAALNPGWIQSGEQEQLKGSFLKFFLSVVHLAMFWKTKTGYEGALKNMVVGDMPFGELKNGGYYNEGKLNEIKAQAITEDKIEAIWRKTEELYETKFTI